MTERTDHAAESRKLLDGYPAVVGNRPFDVAQVHATLALVEQQRIANLIAVVVSAAGGVAKGVHSSEDYLRLHAKVNPIISEVLGLD